MSKIVLHQPHRAWKIPNGSPFCTKTEMFFRVHNIEYDLALFDPKQAPRGKMPYMNMDGTWVSDSQNIIKALSKKHDIDMDSHLTAEQRALSHTMRRMLEEGTYFIIFHNRWIDDQNWNELREVFFSSMPPVIKTIVPPILRRQVKRTCYGQGISRYTDEERIQMLNDDLSVLDHYMSNEGYFFGETISSIDLTVFANLSSLLGAEIPNKIPCEYYENAKFKSYVDRLGKKYFADVVGK